MDAVIAWLDRTHAGDVASIMGVLIALIGFAVTIRAALRAERAANQARRAILFFDVVAEISTAIAAMEELQRLHRSAAWTILPDRYNALRKSLITIRASAPGLSADEQARIQDAISFLADLGWSVEHGSEQDQPPLTIASWNQLVSGHIMELQEVLLKLRSKAGVR